jgi:hypothetical protein
MRIEMGQHTSAIIIEDLSEAIRAANEVIQCFNGILHSGEGMLTLIGLYRHTFFGDLRSTPIFYPTTKAL